jgi:hypothetical protein
VKDQGISLLAAFPLVDKEVRLANRPYFVPDGESCQRWWDEIGRLEVIYGSADLTSFRRTI